MEFSQTIHINELWLKSTENFNLSIYISKVNLYNWLCTKNISQIFHASFVGYIESGDITC